MIFVRRTFYLDYFVMVKFMTENKDLFKYELALVAILKDEAPYQKEWLEYHLLAGVDHFYIYCNDDDVSILKEIWHPYID